MAFALKLTKIRTSLWLVVIVFLVLMLLLPSGHYSVAQPMEGSIFDARMEKAEGLAMALSEDHGPVWDPQIDGSRKTVEEFMEICHQGNTDDAHFKGWLNQHIEPHNRKHQFFTAQLAYNFLYWMKVNGRFDPDDRYHRETPLDQLTEDMVNSTDRVRFSERTLKSFVEKTFSDSTDDERRSFMRHLELYRAKQSPQAKSSGVGLANYYHLIGLYRQYLVWVYERRGEIQENLASPNIRQTLNLIEKWKEDHGWTSPEQGIRSLGVKMAQQDMWELLEVKPQDYNPEDHMSLLAFKAFLLRELKVSEVDQNKFMSWLLWNHSDVRDHKIYKKKDLFMNYSHSLNSTPFGMKKQMIPDLFKMGVIKFSEILHRKYSDKLDLLHLNEMIKSFDTESYDKRKFLDFALSKGYSFLEYEKGILWDTESLNFIYRTWKREESPEKREAFPEKGKWKKWKAYHLKNFSKILQRFKGFFSSLLSRIKNSFFT